jgi:hypothetical protein
VLDGFDTLGSRTGGKFPKGGESLGDEESSEEEEKVVLPRF